MKVMLPGSSGPTAEASLPFFREYAEAMTVQWTEIIGNRSGKKVDLNVSAWLSRATLDSIGKAAFGFRFGAIRDDSHVLVRSDDNMLLVPSLDISIEHNPTRYLTGKIFSDTVRLGKFCFRQSQRIFQPRVVLRTCFPRLQLAKVGTDVAKELVQEKAETLLQGKGKKEISSVFSLGDLFLSSTVWRSRCS
ncbi:hypothetical protein BDN67DRAFT_971134 [Paxillus ammoniavirescens]|nr:hypothetical protein BDN67DRAFT_971134 [Paxillus ammoniavirescens]